MVYDKGTTEEKTMDHKRIRLPEVAEMELWATWGEHDIPQPSLDVRRPSTDRFLVPFWGPTAVIFLRHCVLPRVLADPSGYIPMVDAGNEIGAGPGKVRNAVKRLGFLGAVDLLIDGPYVQMNLHRYVLPAPKSNSMQHMSARWLEALWVEIEASQMSEREERIGGW